MAPHYGGELTYCWRREIFRIEEITSVSFADKKGRWAVLEILLDTRKGPRHIEFVTGATEEERAAILDALGAKK